MEHLGYEIECELENREIIGRPMPLKNLPTQSGQIHLDIKVNRYGEVSLVTLKDKGTTLVDRKLIDDVCEDALNTLFNESATAPVFQSGTLLYVFTAPEVQRDTVFVVLGNKEDSDSLQVVDIIGGGEPAEGIIEYAEAVEAPREEHLIFKKVSIDGPLTEFVSDLRNTGLTYKGIKDNVGVLEGTFAGISGAKIYALAINNETYKVIVDFPGQDTWTSMKKQYLYFKRSYTSKYFSSPKSVERFPNFIPEGSGREHVAFREETAVYSSTYDVPNGTIVISVKSNEDGNGKFFLRLEYIDEMNSVRHENEALEDI